jgi:hypothetical protein
MTMAYEYGYKIGTTSGNTVNVESLGAGLGRMPPPASRYIPYVEGVDTENGDIVALGLPSVVWIFPFLSLAQRDILRAYCTGASATVFIETMGIDNAEAYLKLTGKMLWPQQETRESAGRRLNFELNFIQMEIYT